MKVIGRIVIGLGLLALAGTLQAQTTAAGTDSIVQLTAEAAGLSRVGPESLPLVATYWVVTPEATGSLLPWPCPPPDPTLPAYVINDNPDHVAILIDATGGQVSTTTADGETISVATALTNLAAEVAGVIDLAQGAERKSQRQTMGMLAADDLTLPGEDDINGEGGYTNNFIPFQLNTNALWLEVSNLDWAGGVVYANLHRAEGTVYGIKVATSLTGNWQMEQEVWPSDTNCQPFTLETLGRSVLFFKAEDITGKDSDGDSVPDFWVWFYWGNLTNYPAMTNLDYASGNTFAWDYSNNVTPTVFSFMGVEVTNNYVRTMSVPVQLDVAGYPYYVATLVDDTNFANAVWNTYAGSNLTVNLGLTEGWHEVWIGLRGHGDDPAAAVWRWRRLKLDYTPPALFITGPTNATVDVPLIQLTGFSPKALGSISCTLSNALGVATNLDAGITDQRYDPDVREFTTNYFECLDLPLTNGVNVITLQVMDEAGNETVTNFAFTLDYTGKTNPPGVQLTWPQDGLKVCGGNVTLYGQVDDPTATVCAILTGTNGDTNVIPGLVERSGRFWVENVPLNGGTNDLSLVVSNVVGNVTVTNLQLVQSELTLTLDAVADPQQLWQPAVDLTGTISAAAAAVWVNGVPGTNNGDGTWRADNVPTTPGGVAIFQLTAYPAEEAPVDGSADGGVNPLTANAAGGLTNPDKPPRIHAAAYKLTTEDISEKYDWVSGELYAHGTYDYHDDWNWEEGKGGGRSDNYKLVSDNWGEEPGGWWLRDQYDWPPGAAMGTVTRDWQERAFDGGWDDWGWETNASTLPALPWEHCAVKISGAAMDRNAPGYIDTVSGGRAAQTQIKLETGGKAKSRMKNLFRLTGTAASTAYTYQSQFTDDSFSSPQSPPIAPPEIEILGRHLDTNGGIYAILPDGTTRDVTPVVKNVDYYTFDVQQQKYHSYFEVFVDQPNPGTTYTLSDTAGHAFWQFKTDAPADAQQLYIASYESNYLGQSWGFYPHGANCGLPGQLQNDSIGNDGNGHPFSVKRVFYIGFPDLLEGLIFTRGMSNAPPEYCFAVYGYSCVGAATDAGRTAGIALPTWWNPWNWMPQNFGAAVVLKYPGPLDDETPRYSN